MGKHGRDPHPIRTGGGLACPKCGVPMQRFRHSAGWKPLPDRLFYRYWDICSPCRHMQHYAEAKVSPSDSAPQSTPPKVEQAEMFRAPREGYSKVNHARCPPGWFGPHDLTKPPWE